MLLIAITTISTTSYWFVVNDVNKKNNMTTYLSQLKIVKFACNFKSQCIVTIVMLVLTSCSLLIRIEQPDLINEVMNALNIEDAAVSSDSLLRYNIQYFKVFLMLYYD